MKVTRVLNKLNYFSYLFFRFKNYKLAFNFAHYHFPYNLLDEVECRNEHLYFRKSGNQIPVAVVPVFNERLDIMVLLLNNKRIKVVSSSASHIQIVIDDIFLHIQSVANLFTAFEIFIEQIYDLSMPTPNNVIVDIGMNVGYASLFFASLDKVKKIYSFEPFPQTFEEAQHNLQLNPSLANKIQSYNEGISDYTGTISVPSFESGSAIATTSNVIAVGNSNTKAHINVSIKSIVEVLQEVFKQHPDTNIYYKIDCEGEEYKIVEALYNVEETKKIAGFIIEWHVKGPEPIIEYLEKYQFYVVNLPKPDHTSGMLYAFNSTINSQHR